MVIWLLRGSYGSAEKSIGTHGNTETLGTKQKGTSNVG